MNRRELFKKAAAIAAAGFTVGMSLEAKADALEHAMIEQLDYHIPEPAAFCDVNWPKPIPNFGEMTKETRPNLMHYDPRLPKMPQRPTLVDFFKLRWAPSLHVLQSANIALEKDLDEKVILACLLHDIAVGGFIRTDHGYWAAQLLGPYVDEEVAWAIRAHQVLRFFPDESVGYEYPQAYIKYFGEDYRPPDYIQDAYQIARNHKWYMTSRLITLNDLYAFEPGVHPEIDQFEDIIGRNFDQPKEGLGFDGSPVAHMWRSMIWPNNFL